MEVTLTAALERYRDVLAVTVSPSSARTYTFRLRWCVKELGPNRIVDDVLQPDLERLLASYRNGRRPNTVALLTTCLKQFFAWCEEVEIIARNPAQRLRAPRRTKWQPRALSEAAMLQLLGRLTQPPDSDDWKAVRNEVLVRLLVFSGLRRAEIAGLKWDDIDFAGGVIDVLGKGEKRRLVPLLGTLVAPLRRLQDVYGRAWGYVISKGEGLGMHTYTINAIFTRWVKAQTGMSITPHKLRHTFATLLVEKGASLDEVRDLLGHESIATTQIYVKTSTERLRSAVDRLK